MMPRGGACRLLLSTSILLACSSEPGSESDPARGADPADGTDASASRAADESELAASPAGDADRPETGGTAGETSQGESGGESGDFCSGNEDWCISSLLFEDTFDGVESLSSWLPVFQDAEGSSVEISDGRLEITASRGTTVWFVPELEGNVLVEYDITMIDAGGPYDRVSDLNQYWMASDPDKVDWLGDPHEGLVMYYVGMGGNDNSTTRFRKMTTDGADVASELLGEYTDANHLLSGAGPYHVEIVVFEGLVQFSVNGEVYFSYQDATLHTQGRFGFRTVRNHETVDDFRVYRLTQSPADR